MLNLPELLAGIEDEPVSTELGRMGKILRAHHHTVCILGNGDIPGAADRSTVAIAMDDRGRVPLGNVGPATYRPSNGILEVETNYPYLLAQIDKYQAQADVMVIDLSDLSRLDKAPAALPEVEAGEREYVLRNIDQFVGQILTRVNPNRDLLLLISPSPTAAQIKNKDTFTPVIALGPGYHKGILTSGSTRRDYVVANTDIASTVLRFFGLTDSENIIIGEPFSSATVGARDPLLEAKDLEQSSSIINRLRSPLVKAYVFALIAVIVLVLLAILTTRKYMVGYILPPVLAMAVVPLVYLFLGILPLPADWMYMAAALLLTVVLTWLLVKIGRGDYLLSFVITCAVTMAVLNIDLLTGASLLKTSVLGYDPMAGARYYGIGNEYTGVLIGCAIIFGVACYHKLTRRWVLGLLGVFFASQAYLLAAPSLGACADGFLTAPAAFLVTLTLLANFRPNLRNLSIIALIIITAVLGFSFYDMSRPSEMQTHVGRAAHQIAAGGLSQAFLIIGRKLGMNLKLIRYTVWSRVFLVIIATLILLIYQPVGVMLSLRNKHPLLFKGFAGIITSTVVGFIINDSGIVAAATTSIYVAVPILILTLIEVSASLISPVPESASPE
jgi:hypothetical protein